MTEHGDNVKHDANSSSGKPRREFDPTSLRLSQDFVSEAGVKKIRTVVPVDRPKSNWWFQAHPDEINFSLATMVLDLKERGGLYLVDRSLWSELAMEPLLSPRLLVTCMTRQNIVFIWPLRLPRSDGSLDSWSQSAIEALKLARCNWIRLQSDRDLGAYVASEPVSSFSPPDWKSQIHEDFAQLLEIGFRGRKIDNTDHPVLKDLRGEA